MDCPDKCDLATIKDLELYWRPLDDDEKARASILIKYASAKLRIRGKNSGVDVDEKIALDDTGSYKLLCTGVVCNSVKRAICTPIDSQPVETFSQTAGPYSESLKYTNPNGDLWFSKKELKELGIYGKNKVYSITPKTEGDNIYG